MFVYILLAFLKLQSIEAAKDSVEYRYKRENYISCEDFVKNTTFDARKVLDIDWKIFYFWNMQYENSYNIRFSLPSPVLIDRFRVELDDEITPRVNWSQAELFMETSVEFSALFIRTNVTGIFLVISSYDFHEQMQPSLMVALKVVDHGYLAVENCNVRLCFALAPIESMPQADEVTAAAAKIGFNSEYGRSYLIRPQAPPTTSPLDEVYDDDIEVDAKMDDEADFNRM